jgi:3-methyladenine DNA glycosylase AlkD
VAEKGNKGKTESPTARQAAGSVVAALHKQRNSARARAVQRYFSDEIAALGVAAPTVRGLVKNQMKPLRGTWMLDEAIECCDLLLKEPQTEPRMAGVLVLAAFKKDFTPMLTDHAWRWLRKRLDNWALVDVFSGSVLSPLLEKYPGIGATRTSPLQVWSRDKCLWVRRAAIVTLVPFARRGQLLDLSYRLARERLGDQEPLMQKAIGWLLREAGRTDAGRLQQFLLRQGFAIPRISLRYAIEHFSPENRAKVMIATRGETPRRANRPLNKG